jgi:hypothetical protein
MSREEEFVRKVLAAIGDLVVYWDKITVAGNSTSRVGATGRAEGTYVWANAAYTTACANNRQDEGRSLS